MYGVPVSTCDSRTANQSFCALICLRKRPSDSYLRSATEGQNSAEEKCQTIWITKQQGIQVNNNLDLHQGAAQHNSPSVELLKLLSPAIRQARTFVGAHQAPAAVLLHTLHEQIRNPESIEQVTSTLLFFARVLLEIQELEDVSMPWLQVHGKCTGPLQNRRTPQASKPLKQHTGDNTISFGRPGYAVRRSQNECNY